MGETWDYKTVKRIAGGLGFECEIDGIPAEMPTKMVALLKELGHEGWELVSHTDYVLSSVFSRLSDEEQRNEPPYDAEGAWDARRSDTLVEWWTFKRPLASGAYEGASPSQSAVDTETTLAPPPKNTTPDETDETLPIQSAPSTTASLAPSPKSKARSTGKRKPITDVDEFLALADAGQRGGDR